MIIKQFDVVVVGELNVDIILNNIDSFPEVGKEKIAQNMTLVLGSSSAIFASNLSSLGAKVSFIGKVGYDNFALLVNSSLKKAGVDTSSITKSLVSNTGGTIVLNYDEDRAMVTYPGAMNDLKINDIDFDFLAKARHLHFSSYFLQPGIKDDLVQLLKKAKNLGLTTSVDPQWDPAEKWDMDLHSLLPYIDVFFPNMKEFMNLTKSDSLDEAIAKVKSYANILVIKDGNNGAYLWKENKILHQNAFVNHNVVDCIGAGDSFNAGFISKFIKRCALEECLEFGAITGAINTTHSGGTGAFEKLENAKKIAKEKFNYDF